MALTRTAGSLRAILPLLGRYIPAPQSKGDDGTTRGTIAELYPGGSFSFAPARHGRLRVY
jgi:hypothetical protein